MRLDMENLFWLDLLLLILFLTTASSISLRTSLCDVRMSSPSVHDFPPGLPGLLPPPKAYFFFCVLIYVKWWLFVYGSQLRANLSRANPTSCPVSWDGLQTPTTLQRVSSPTNLVPCLICPLIFRTKVAWQRPWSNIWSVNGTDVFIDLIADGWPY